MKISFILFFQIVDCLLSLFIIHLDLINGASYLGLVATASDNLRVVRFPKLVSIALLYHQLNLETETEKRSFSEYNVDGVLSHLNTQADKKLVHDYAMILPANKITTTVSLLKTIRIESAEMIMAQRTPEEKHEIISRLRGTVNPGAWMEDYIEQERATARAALRSQAAGLLDAQLSHAVKAKTRHANLIADPDQRRLEMQEIDNWTREIETEIKNLAPATESLARGGNPSARTEREATIVIMQRILNLINPPVNQPVPMNI